METYIKIQVPEGSLVITPDELGMFEIKGVDLHTELKIIQEEIRFYTEYLFWLEWDKMKRMF